MTLELLFVFTHSPYSGHIAREGLEALLAAAAYDQNPGVLFLNEAIWQLIEQGESTSHKHHAKMIKALPLYGVDNIFLDSQALYDRGLENSALIIPARPLALTETLPLLINARHILSF